MREIQLTQGQVALVDDEDYEKLNQFKWYAFKGWNVFYAGRQSSKVNGKCRKLRMHHDIIGFPPKGLQTDHRDGNGLNNQRENLRFATNRQNQQNRKHQGKSSRYPGVCWQKNDKKWQANIQINGKLKYLGNFKTEKEAFEAYRCAVEELGEKMLEGTKI